MKEKVIEGLAAIFQANLQEEVGDDGEDSIYQLLSKIYTNPKLRSKILSSLYAKAAGGLRKIESVDASEDNETFNTLRVAGKGSALALRNFKINSKGRFPANSRGKMLPGYSMNPLVCAPGFSSKFKFHEFKPPKFEFRNYCQPLSLCFDFEAMSIYDKKNPTRYLIPQVACYYPRVILVEGAYNYHPKRRKPQHFLFRIPYNHVLHMIQTGCITTSFTLSGARVNVGVFDKFLSDPESSEDLSAYIEKDGTISSLQPVYSEAVNQRYDCDSGKHPLLSDISSKIYSQAGPLRYALLSKLPMKYLKSSIPYSDTVNIVDPLKESDLEAIKDYTALDLTLNRIKWDLTYRERQLEWGDEVGTYLGFSPIGWETYFGKYMSTEVGRNLKDLDKLQLLYDFEKSFLKVERFLHEAHGKLGDKYIPSLASTKLTVGKGERKWGKLTYSAEDVPQLTKYLSRFKYFSSLTLVKAGNKYHCPKCGGPLTLPSNLYERLKKLPEGARCLQLERIICWGCGARYLYNCFRVACESTPTSRHIVFKDYNPKDVLSTKKGKSGPKWPKV